MKAPLAFIALLSLIASPFSHAEDSLSPLAEGKTYSIGYLLDGKSISDAGLPKKIQILKCGESPWYYVKQSKEGTPMWLNTSLVFTIKEISQDEFDQDIIKRPLRSDKAEQGAAANP